jgi:hypothetical protein
LNSLVKHPASRVENAGELKVIARMRAFDMGRRAAAQSARNDANDVFGPGSGKLLQPRLLDRIRRD